MTVDKTSGLKTYNENLNKIVKESLQQALLMLLDTKDFEKISVTELCKKAGVSRMAFYGNYESIDELLESIVREYSSDLIYRIGSPFRHGVNLNWYEEMFTRIEANADILSLLFGAGFKYKYLSIINNSILHNSDIAIHKKYLRLTWAGSIANIIIYWIDNGLRESVGEIAKFCYNNLSKIAEKA